MRQFGSLTITDCPSGKIAQIRNLQTDQIQLICVYRIIPCSSQESTGLFHTVQRSPHDYNIQSTGVYRFIPYSPPEST
ncbi:hypothetical protein CEXT_257711 [Caerostris extrusa]|uniref:Uncharacterized protein n=1 Tax=Caerostris extrusa TaxID=172846 RepID=A0AAV4PWT7_CAEEX|nr:hypothetical protein CEXT_257711 [Caerostris extrusa]